MAHSLYKINIVGDDVMLEQIDSNIYSILFKTINPTNTTIMLGISFLASGGMLIVITIISFLLLKNKKIPKYMTLNLFLVFIINRLLKFIIRRPRPQAFVLVIENGYSFPSAHAMIGFAFYGFIIYLIMKSKKNKKEKIIYSTLLSLLILVVGISRIYLGVHYASDVIGGFLIALLYLVIFIKYIYKKNIFKNDKN